MKLNTGMRCHDLCPKMEMEKLFARVREHDIRQIQLAFGKSISDYDFAAGHYSSGFARTIARELEKNKIHVAVLGCYIHPVNPIESRRQAEVARFIEHMKYARIIGADMVGTETGRLDPDFRVADDGEIKLLQQDVLADMLEEYFAAGDEEFLSCVEYFAPAGKEKRLEEQILGLYEFAMSYPWPGEWLTGHQDDYAVTEDSLDECRWILLLKSYIRSMLEEAKELLACYCMM